jgi:ATP-dependent helicase/nuclease subunit A
MKEKLINEIDESVRMLYVAMTRAEGYVVLVGEEKPCDFSEISEKTEKIDKLDTFYKQLGYALWVRGSAREHVEMLEAENLPGIDTISALDAQGETPNFEELRKRIAFEAKPGSRNTVSATTYMKYAGCPRKYYVERFLGINASFLTDKDEEVSASYTCEVDAEPDKVLLYGLGISAALIGSLAHEIIEDMNSVEPEDEEELISRRINEVEDEKAKENLRLLLNKYIENYKRIEKSANQEGELVLSLNEASYIIAAAEGANLLVNGFMDRVQVFENKGRYIAVITDYKTNRIRNEEDSEHMKEIYSKQLYLYGKAVMDLVKVDGKSVDEVKLRLYLLDKGESLEMAFDPEKLKAQLKDMAEFFGKTQTSAGIEAFVKAVEEDCTQCSYKELCREKYGRDKPWVQLCRILQI